MLYFNPRTHRGVRPYVPVIAFIVIKISIHAPIVGCDQLPKLLICEACQFQSTHPSWGATLFAATHSSVSSDFNPRTHRGVRRLQKMILKLTQQEFQSTHPSWGATVVFVIEYLNVLISIHAPIVGCDCLCV